MKNPFGGLGLRGLYTPISEDEQEVLERLASSNDLIVHIVGWGFVQNPKITFGDLRVTIPLSITFSQPETPIPVHYFDLELKTGAGMMIFRQRQATVYGGQPLMIQAGVHLDMLWDIAIQHMSPEFVRAFKPGAIGLTNRWMDRDTRDITLTGNTKLGAKERRLLKTLREGEAKVRAIDAEKLKR